MIIDLITLTSSLIQKQAADEIVKCNAHTVCYGLTITPAQAYELVETRSHALSKNGRIEFGGGIIDKIIKAFCDSPYISMHNYTQTIHELLEIFYYYKNETMDIASDDELLKYMKSTFNGVCQGSLDLLSGRELDRIARNLRSGYPYDYINCDFYEDGEDIEDDDEYDE